MSTPTWASYQIRKIAGCACAGNAGNVSPRRRFQRELLVSDPGMHHGTCVTHVPWCMSGSLTCGDGENVPGIPGACAPAILRIWQEAHAVPLVLSQWRNTDTYGGIYLHTSNTSMLASSRKTYVIKWSPLIPKLHPSAYRKSYILHIAKRGLILYTSFRQWPAVIKKCMLSVFVNMGSDNGSFPNGTKPLSNPIFRHCQ